MEEKPLIFKVKRMQLKTRLDPEYYKPEYMQLERELGGHVVKQLQGIVEITRGVSISTKEYCEKGLPYVRILNIKGWTIDTKNMVYVSRKMRKRLNKAQLRGGEILISITGTIGKVAVVPESLRGALVSSDIAVLRLKRPMKEISTFYLVHMLASDYVMKQLKRKKVGQYIPRVNLQDLKSILIPILPRKEQEEMEEEVKRLLTRKKELQKEEERIMEKIRKLRELK